MSPTETTDLTNVPFILDYSFHRFEGMVVAKHETMDLYEFCWMPTALPGEAIKHGTICGFSLESLASKVTPISRADRGLGIWLIEWQSWWESSENLVKCGFADAIQAWENSQRAILMRDDERTTTHDNKDDETAMTESNTAIDDDMTEVMTEDDELATNNELPSNDESTAMSSPERLTPGSVYEVPIVVDDDEESTAMNAPERLTPGSVYEVPIVVDDDEDSPVMCIDEGLTTHDDRIVDSYKISRSVGKSGFVKIDIIRGSDNSSYLSRISR
ncbi:Hypothetical protein R9X50_00407800 [Acrodontium crateriforme]|uniref:Uncharacterized protein n=1 Tax=Acrodontium crateriforme TaxID=150365 RepID=A0AAQ3M7C3_9PEZI|nr:Hypothetical protein R9X50_00407800 [Acrodontium crateriforme]